MPNFFDQYDQNQTNVSQDQSSNHFDQFDQVATQETETISPAMSSVVGFNKAMGDLTRGALQLGSQGLSMLGVDTQRFQDGLKKLHQSKTQEYEVHKAANPKATMGGLVLGILGQAAIPGGAASKVGAKLGAVAGKSAVGAGLLSGIDYAETSEERARRMAVGGAVGAAVPMAGRVLSKVPGLLSPKTRAVGDIAHQVRIGGPEKAFQRAAKAKKLGTKVTPAEATGSEILLGMESKIPVTREIQEKALSSLAKREKVTKGKVYGLLQKIVPEGDKAAAKKASSLYNKVYDIKAQGKILSTIDDNTILKNNLNKLRKDPDWAAEDLTQGTIGELDQLKRFLDHKINTQKVAGSVNKNLKDARGKLVSLLDSSSPAYKEARKISERVILKRKYLDEISEGIKLKPNQESATLDQLYGKLFGTSSAKKEFLAAVRKGGGDVSQANSVIELVNSIRKSPVQKLLGKSVEAKGAAFGQGPLAQAYEKARSLVNGRYNDQVLDLILDPKWDSKIKAILRKQDKAEQIKALIQLPLFKAAAGPAAGKLLSKEDL